MARKEVVLSRKTKPWLLVKRKLSGKKKATVTLRHENLSSPIVPQRTESLGDYVCKTKFIYLNYHSQTNTGDSVRMFKHKNLSLKTQQALKKGRHSGIHLESPHMGKQPQKDVWSCLTPLTLTNG